MDICTIGFCVGEPHDAPPGYHRCYGKGRHGVWHLVFLGGNDCLLDVCLGGLSREEGAGMGAVSGLASFDRWYFYAEIGCPAFLSGDGEHMGSRAAAVIV